jgi:uncharacterized protein YkwD
MSSDKAPARRHASKRAKSSQYPKIAKPLSHVKVPKILARKFVHYFVPHKKNDYKPLFLRIETVSATAALILALFFVATATGKVMVTSGSPQVAAVVVSTLVDLANSDRTSSGLPSLTVSPALEQAAQLKANDMAANSYFAHTSPTGQDPWYWFTQAGYSFTYAGENLAVYFSDSDAVNTAWMNSPEHRANILSDNFTQIGIATADGTYQGQPTTFVVQEFGTPAEPAPEPIAATAPHVSADEAVSTSSDASAPTTVPIAVAISERPAVKGASTGAVSKTAPPSATVTVLQESPTFIAVKYIGTPPPMRNNLAGTTAQTPPSSNPETAALGRFLTSPATDLSFVYGIIGAIVAMALILEVVVETKRQHPHRIVMGLSLISLMFILVFAGHTLFGGSLSVV